MSELTSGFTPFPFRVIAYVRPLVFPIFTRAFIQEILIRNHCEYTRTFPLFLLLPLLGCNMFTY
ncbi:hypothetical protein HanHA89_Chr05g0171941 [Helianthus annuus]|nr:hypothetical protein HanHA89_Chr05g0171941 [Helianthus annuus]